MKKIFLSLTLVLILAVSRSSYASELILYSQDNFEIRSSAYITDAANYISLVRGSNLNVTFTNDKDYSYQKEEPSIDLKVYKKDTKEVVFEIKTPTKRVSDKASDEEIQKSNIENKTYLENFKLQGKNVEVSIPLNFTGGAYDMDLILNNSGKKLNLKYGFSVSDSSYSFTTSDILIEDSNVLAKIGYVSLLNQEETNKVAITITQNGANIFSKEFDKVFYPDEGSILVYEKIPELSGLKGNVELKVEIKDKDGKVILSQSKTVSVLKSNGMAKYYVIAAVILLLLACMFVFLKKRKSKIHVALFGLVALGLSGFVFVGVRAASPCGTQPADTCVENKIVTNVCQKTDSCATRDARAKKFFSTGRVLDLASAASGSYSNSSRSAPVSAKVNICGNIAKTLSAGDNFYVISETPPQSNSWSRKRYHAFNFTKNTAGTITFDPGSGGDKRLVDKAVYDGSCGVTVSVEYQGSETDSGEHQTTIVETGKITSAMCKSKVVNGDVFDFTSGSSLPGKSVCSDTANTGLRNTFIDGSVVMDPVINDTQGIKKKVNICTYLGINQDDLPALKSGNKKFYAILDQTSSWTMIEYPVFSFTFGDINGGIDEYNAGGPNQIKNLYDYGRDKEFKPDISYDGDCGIYFALRPHGWNDTDQHDLGLRLIELGLVDDASCRDDALTASSSYRYDAIETISKAPKLQNGKYANIASFLRGTSGDGSGGLPKCSAVTSCTTNYNWIKSATNGSCGLTVNGSCGATNNTCTAGTLLDTTDTTTDYKWSCNGTNGGTNATTCSAAKPTTPTNGQCSTSNNNVCLQGTSVDLTDTTDNYLWRCDGLNNGSPQPCSISKVVVTPVDGSCGAVVDTCAAGTLDAGIAGDGLWSCNGTNGGRNVTTCSAVVTPPPTVVITKNPTVVLNKGGSCNIIYQIKDIPSGGHCILTGFNISGSGQEVTNLTGTTTVNGLLTNQKYVVTCTGGNPPMTPIIKSIICRVNPDIIEN